MPRRRAVGQAVRAAALAALLLVAGCSSADPDAPQQTRDAQVVAAGPRSPLTVVADADPVAAAGSVSRALFARSDVAAVARAGDRGGILLGSSTAVGLGVPLLLEGGDGSAVAAELDRLGVGRVLAVGEA